MTPAGFEWRDEPWGPALQCAALAALADHVFTTRQLRLRGEPDDEARGWAAVARSVGAAREDLVRLTQVHGRDVVLVRRGSRPPASGERPPADIVITDEPGVAVSVQVADCVPLLLADPRTGAVCAAHAGWRGMVAGVPGAAVAALVDAVGSAPADLVAAAGPSIGPCCYDVGAEVRDALLRAGHDTAAVLRWTRPAGPGRAAGGNGSLRLDLWAATRDLLLAAGLEPGHIHQPRLCTACHPQVFWSYRRDGAGTGRLAAAIRSGPPRRPSRG